MRNIATTIIILTCLSLRGWAEDFVIRQSGKDIGRMSLASMKKTFKPVKIQVFEPHEGRKRVYVGFALKSLLRRAYGRLPASDEALRVICLDGYSPIVAEQDCRVHNAYLVYGSADGLPFEIRDNAKKVPLGPFYLIWENLQDKALDPRDSNLWPYQVKTLDLEKAADCLPRLTPPAQSSPAVKRGFVAYLHFCVACHSIDGEGGKSAPSLSGVTGRYSRDWLRGFIDEPSKIRPQTAMPPLMTIKNRQGTIDDIILYLKSVSKLKSV